MPRPTAVSLASTATRYGVPEVGSVGRKNLIAKGAQRGGERVGVQGQITAAATHLNITKQRVLLGDHLMQRILPDCGLADARQRAGRQRHLSCRPASTVVRPRPGLTLTVIAG